MEQAAVERFLQVAIQACIDVATHILASRAVPIPDEYAQAFLQLGDEGLLPQDLAERMASAARFRNVLVHAYTDVDAALVFAGLGRLDDLEAFALHISRALDDL